MLKLARLYGTVSSRSPTCSAESALSNQPVCMTWVVHVVPGPYTAPYPPVLGTRLETFPWIFGCVVNAS